MKLLFKYLQITIIISTMGLRAIISLPLAFAAVHHFSFLSEEASWLVYVVAYISIFAIESILTLFSLLSAYFKREKLQKAYVIAFSFVVLFFLLNSFLLWEIRTLYKTATLVSAIVFQVINLASVVLAESIGFMNDEREEVMQVVPVVDNVPDILRQARDNDNLTNADRIRIVYNAKYFARSYQIADFLGLNKSTVSRVIASFTTDATE